MHLGSFVSLIVSDTDNKMRRWLKDKRNGHNEGSTQTQGKPITNVDLCKIKL